jgi:hypothetical protein
MKNEITHVFQSKNFFFFAIEIWNNDNSYCAYIFALINSVSAQTGSETVTKNPKHSNHIISNVIFVKLHARIKDTI